MLFRAFLLFCLLAAAPRADAQNAPITVFAAASLAEVLPAIVKEYEGKTGRKITVSLAGSSALARQIEASGGADIFFSADLEWMDYLDTRGRIAKGTRVNLLGNRIVLVAPKDSKANISIAQNISLKPLLNGGRLAVADPDSVPAGKYAKAALAKLGAWDDIAGQIAPAENVRVALAYVARGEAPLGIVYATDAASDRNVRVIATLPESSHPPIVYPAALVQDGKKDAAAFLAFLSGPEAAAIFRNAGFAVLPR